MVHDAENARFGRGHQYVLPHLGESSMSGSCTLFGKQRFVYKRVWGHFCGSVSWNPADGVRVQRLFDIASVATINNMQYGHKRFAYQRVSLPLY